MNPIGVFIGTWRREFNEVMGYPYKESAGDGAAVKRVVRGEDPVALVAEARRAWQAAMKDERKFFSCKQAVSITGFCAKLNQIRFELRGKDTNGNRVIDYAKSW